MFKDRRSFDALHQALRMYLIIGVVLVACGVRSWNPAPTASWFDRAVWVVAEVLLWPKVLPEIAIRRGVMLPQLRF